eukprot:TRINITY_DN866_c0_g2_i2.p2 TRINITY_DN866_c0_g2~~TRINITY_DN866_c0_g2_i2.p2  ORF type:complete len:271 (+),score=11.67 TRINITY_DN866_c0_g2_i2:174-986(+)
MINALTILIISSILIFKGYAERWSDTVSFSKTDADKFLNTAEIKSSIFFTNEMSETNRLLIQAINNNTFELTEASSALVAAINEGNSELINSILENEQREDIALAFLTAEKNGGLQNLAVFINQTMTNIFESQSANEIVAALEKIIENGGCDRVFSILLEVDTVAMDESNSEKLQIAFSRSQTIVRCANEVTASPIPREIQQLSYLYSIGVLLSDYPVPQDVCQESTSCIFLMQSTRFLLDLRKVRCVAKRVCEFIGFEEERICQRECQT